MAACIGVVALVALYHWPLLDPVVCFLAVCPAFVCLGVLLPFVLSGFWAVRLPWFLLGLAIWTAGLAATDDVAQWLSFWPGRSRAAFETMHASFLHRANVTAPAGHPLRVPLRIVTWNLALRPRSVAEALRQIAGLEPDLVFLQEVNAETLRGAVRRSDWFAAYHVTAGHGRALLSRFPVTPLPQGTFPPSRGDLSQVEVAPGFTVVCVNVHLARRVLVPNLFRFWNPDAVEQAIGQTSQRLEDLRDILHEYSAREPLVLAGDFNLPPHYPDLLQATRGLTDAFAAKGYGWGKTVPARMPILRVDMVFVPPGSVVHYAAAVSTDLSDHRMTMAEVSLPATEPH